MTLIRDVGIAVGAGAAMTAINGSIVRWLARSDDPSSFVLPTLTTMGTGLAAALIGGIARGQGAHGALTLMLPVGIGIASGALVGAAVGLKSAGDTRVELAPGRFPMV